MANFELESLLRLYRFATARRLRALADMFEAAMTLGLSVLTQELGEALAYEEETLKLEQALASKGPRWQGLFRDTWRRRQAEGQERLARLLFRAIGLCASATAEDEARRAALLSGVFREHQAIAEARRQPRPPEAER